MEKVYKYIVENIASEKIEKTTAIELLKMLKQIKVNKSRDIAVIGMSIKTSNAKTVDEFWDIVGGKLDCITDFPDSRREDIDSYIRLTESSSEQIKYNKNAYLDEIDKFDYKFFRLSPKEASLMDPNQRLFLETAWSAVEDAGYGGKKLSGSNTGVYLGLASSVRDLYSRIIIETDPGAFPMSLVGNLPAVAPSRLSYLLDLKGPSMVIDTSCSSSLVAVSLACQAIEDGHCDMAVAGGIKLNTVPVNNGHYKIGIEASDARTWAFDDCSDGSGIGEGVGAVLLKPLDRALNDGDNIYAVIKGSAVNQDGASIGITAPNPEAQAEAILKAWEKCGIDPVTVSYIETHGTGTKLGDPLEAEGIKRAFRKYTQKNQFCAIGSVKSNIGHSSEAAGIISFIKAVMALKNKKIPPTINFQKPNKTIDFNNSPVYINTKLRNWANSETPRRCGVSAFGISGTNCHVILEEGPEPLQIEASPDIGLNVLVLSAKSSQALKELINDYILFLEENSGSGLRDICYTAGTGRGHYSYRLAVIAGNISEMKAGLKVAVNLDASDEGTYYGYHRVIESSRAAVRETGDITEQEAGLMAREAQDKLLQFVIKGKNSEDMLKDILKLYVAGGEINWEDLYKGEKVRKISAPVYPFERSRCWINIPETKRADSEKADDEFYHVINWKEREAVPEEVVKNNGAVLVFCGENSLGKMVCKELLEDGDKIIEVQLGQFYEKAGSNKYFVSGSEEDYERLFAEPWAASVSKIAHMFSVTGRWEPESEKDLDDCLRKGVHSLFYIIRSMLKNGIDQDISVSLIGDYIYEVSGSEECINPHNAALIGLGKSLALEYPQISCKGIDIDEYTDARTIIKEMNVRSRLFMSAYRKGKRYQEELVTADLKHYEPSNGEIQKDGCYLITGGLGGIGLEMAKHLSLRNKVRLALVNRSGIPDRALWDEILNRNEDKKLCKKIKDILEIEASGTEITCYKADISNFSEASTVIQDVLKRNRRINGIIHCAGVPGIGFLIRKTEDAFNQVLNPKIKGTWILDKLTENLGLDFFIMFSSGLSMMSEAGQGDYSAANSYLDSYSIKRNKKGRKTLTINWVSWKEAGMSVDYGFNVDGVTKAISTENALKGIDEAMNRNVKRLLIGEFSYDPRFVTLMLEKLPFGLCSHMTERLLKIKASQVEKVQARRQESRPKPSGNIELKGKNGYTLIEKEVAAIYNEVLGFDEINIFDSFFELGGDSMLLNKMHALLEERYPGKVKLINLFSYTCIHSLSEYISKKSGQQVSGKAAENQPDQFQGMLNEIEKGNLSIDEAIKNIIEV